jgi:hypothetical protein
MRPRSAVQTVQAFTHEVASRSQFGQMTEAFMTRPQAHQDMRKGMTMIVISWCVFRRGWCAVDRRA